MAITKHQRELLQRAANSTNGRVSSFGGPFKSVRMLADLGLAELKPNIQNPQVRTDNENELAMYVDEALSVLRVSVLDWQKALSLLQNADHIRYLLAKHEYFITDAGRAEAIK